MRILGAIALLVAAIWTWNIIHSSSDLETHAAIREKMVDYIQQVVQAQKPQSTNFEMEKFWTESPAKGALTAHFIYSYNEPDSTGGTTTTRIQGTGDLSLKERSESGEEIWVLNKVSTSSDALIFNESLLITPGDSNPVVDPASTTTTVPATK